MSFKERWILFVAEGLGAGKVPLSPGTAGSFAGLGWLALICLFENLAVFLLLTAASIPVSIYLSGKAERILKRRDPGSVVIDEIVAMPVCYLAWIFTSLAAGAEFSIHGLFGSAQGLSILGAGFVLFRIFDIWKPWPVRNSQNLSGGWGVAIDDILAAVYVNLVMIPFLV